jgi:hypothetical protein
MILARNSKKLECDEKIYVLCFLACRTRCLVLRMTFARDAKEQWALSLHAETQCMVIRMIFAREAKNKKDN